MMSVMILLIISRWLTCAGVVIAKLQLARKSMPPKRQPTTLARTVSSTDVKSNGLVMGNAKPHILFLLVDDLGWGSVGWTRDGKTEELVTPNMDALAREGIILDRHYVHASCSPTRSAIQSGRAPIHVNALNAAPSSHNPNDTVSGFAGIPRHMTGLAEVLRGVGYSTHMIGKWDAGMATPDHTPAGRGYDTSLVFFGHQNGAWTHDRFENGDCINVKDLWEMDGNISFPGRPNKAAKNDEACSFKNQHPKGRCVYEDKLFEDRVIATIEHHSSFKPLFIFWAPRTVHAEVVPPLEAIAKFEWIDSRNRRFHHAAMVWFDDAVGRVVDTIKKRGMWQNTLMVMSSDNGADQLGEIVGTNYPLKGGKFSTWEGGIRAASFLSGGFVPHAVRGSVQTNLVAVWDWYATFAALAGADPFDTKAAQAGLPPHDSINQWPMLSGANTTGLRTRVEIGDNVRGRNGSDGYSGDEAFVGGLIVAPYKIIICDNCPGSVWTEAVFPIKTGYMAKRQEIFDSVHKTEKCGRTPEDGCLYDIFADPGERRNLARTKPDIHQKLLKEVDALSKSLFAPERGKVDGAACRMAFQQNDGYWGPFLP